MRGVLRKHSTAQHSTAEPLACASAEGKVGVLAQMMCRAPRARRVSGSAPAPSCAPATWPRGLGR